MHDPSTVAFDIKYPWKSRPSQFWPKGYRNTFITIWHEDPLNFEGKCGCRDDDSCGWSRPPMTLEERARVEKQAAFEYGTIFGKQVAIAEKKSYARVCYVPTCYDAIYWVWRHFKYEANKGKRFARWRSYAPNQKELERIFNLSSNPVDNLRMTFEEVKDEESFRQFFFCVYRCFQDFNRPWYQHPRWHVHHWQIQIHPVQKLKRWLFTRCSHCGQRFGWNESPMGTWGGDKVWHDRCDPRGPRMAAQGPSPATFQAEETTGSVH
jgi:hypothetical protein